MKRFVKILLLSTAALLLCSELPGATRESFSDWVVECAKPSACAAKTFRQGGTIDGYPSLKISAKNRTQRELFLADARILDGSKKIGVRIDSTSLIELEPQRDLKRLSSDEYQVVNDAQRQRLLSRMLSGRKLQLFYTNVRGQEREPEFSLMGMGDALLRLASPPTGAKVESGERSAAKPGQSKPPDNGQADQQRAVKAVPSTRERAEAAAPSSAGAAAGHVDSRSKVVQKFRNWQLRCAADGACAATTYKAGGAIEGYPVIKVVKGGRDNRQLRIDNAQNMNDKKNIWFRVDANKEIRLVPGKDFTRVSTDEFRISNVSLERRILQEILAGSSLRFSYLNTRGQWRQPRYSLLGATAAMNALVGGTDNPRAAGSSRTAASSEPRTAAATAPAQRRRASAAAAYDPLDDALQQNRQKDSRSWWQRIGRSGKRWSYSCSGSRCIASAQGALKSGKNDISMQISGSSKGSRQFMLSGAANLDASKPMRMQIDGSLPLHVVPRKDFSAYGRDDIRIINARLIDTLVSKMLRGNEMWVTYTNRQGRPRVVKFSLNGMGASLKKLGRGR